MALRRKNALLERPMRLNLSFTDICDHLQGSWGEGFFLPGPGLGEFSRTEQYRQIRGKDKRRWIAQPPANRSEEHTSELQSLRHLVCRLLLEKKKKHSIHQRL